MKKKCLFFIFFIFISFVNAQTTCVIIDIDTISDPYCPSSFQGELQANVSGGSGNYTFQWLDSLGNNPGGIPANSLTLSNLNLHKYWFYVTDLVQGCTDSASASFLEYTCIDDTASISVVSNFDLNPVDYETYSNCQILISNEGCQVDLKPQFTVSHNLPIEQGAIQIEAYNTISSNWEILNYTIVNGDAVGYWGDANGENLNCGGSQSKMVQVKFNQFGPAANLGEYSATLKLWKVNNSGDLLSVISEETIISIQLQDTICNDFVFNNNIIDASCSNQSDGQITMNSSGGLLPIEYGFNTPVYSFVNSFNFLIADQYILYAKDGNDCQISDTIILGPPVLEPDSIWFTNITPSNAVINWPFNNLVDGYKFRYSINGASNWTVVASPGLYDDSLSNPNTSKLINNLMGNMTYVVQIKTNSLIDNCEEGWSNSYYFDTPLESFEFDINNSCFNENNGSILLNFNAEMAGYTFSWLGPNGFSSSDTSILGLNVGDYNLVVSNPLSMIILDTTLSVSENSLQSLELSVNDDPSLVINIGGQSFVSVCNPNTYIQPVGQFTDFSWSNGFDGQDLLLDTLGNNSILTLSALDTNGCLQTSDSIYLTIVTDFINFRVANQNNEVIRGNYLFCASDTSLALDISDYTTGEFSVRWNEIVGFNVINIGNQDTIVLFPTMNSVYTLEIFNCSYEFSLMYEESIPVQSQVVDNLCFGDELGAIILNINSPSPEINVGAYNEMDSLVFFASSTNFVDTIASLASGEYTVLVTDSTLICSYNNEFTVAGPDSLFIDSLEIDHLNCVGDDYGMFLFDVVGGTPPFSFELNGNATQIVPNQDNSFLLDSLLPGNYSLSVSDSNNCSSLAYDFSIFELLDTLSVSTSDFSFVNCFGDSGFVQLSVSGGMPSYNFDLYRESILLSSQLDSLFEDLISGNYQAVVVDANDCRDSIDFVINSSDELIVEEDISMHQNINCFGIDDGSITVDVSGGQAPYTVSVMSTELTSPPFVFDGLMPDTILVNVVDSFGCASQITSIITESDSLYLDTFNIVNIACSEEFGEAQFVIQGGTPNYTFELNDNVVPVVFLNDSTISIDSLSFNNYELLVFDDFSCSDSINFNIIGQTSDLDINILNVSDTIDCFGDSTAFIQIESNGGLAPYSYSLILDSDTVYSDTNLVNFTNLPSGNYSVVVIDGEECYSSVDTIIYQRDEIVASEENLQNVSCYGFQDGSFDLIIEGGTLPYTIEVNMDSTLNYPYNFINLSSDSFNLLILDNYNCEQELEVIISEPDSLYMSEYSTKDISCADTMSIFSFELTGGTFPYLFNLNGNDSTPIFDQETDSYQFQNLMEGDYFLTSSDTNMCSDTVSFSIADFRVGYDLNLIDFLDTIVCFGDSTGFIEVSANAGLPPYLYSLVFESDTIQTQSGVLFENLIAGDYQVVVSDSNLCTESIMVTINQNEEILVNDSLELHNDVSCFSLNDGSFTLNVSGGSPNYFINIIDSVLFSYPHTYSNLSPGTYELIVTDNFGCEQEFEVVIEEPDSLYFESFDLQDVLCQGDSSGALNYVVTGGVAPYYYMLDSDSLKNLNQLYSGTSTIEIIDANGCVIDSSFNISEPDLLTLSIVDSLTNNISCFGGDDGLISIQANGGTQPYRYQFENQLFQSENSFSNLESGTYNLSVLDTNNCLTTITHTLFEPSESFVISNYTLSDTLGFCALCFGDSSGFIDIEVSGGTGQFSYFINNMPNLPQNSSLIDSLVGGQEYEFFVVDSLGCHSDTVIVNCNSTEQIQIQLLDQTDPTCCYSCDGMLTVSASGGTQPYQYSFDGNSFQTSNLFIQTCVGYNQFEVTDFYSCSGSDSILIQVNDCLEIDTINFMDFSLPAVINYDSCKLENTGVIYVKANNGDSPYEFAFNGGEFESGSQMIYDQLSSGIYPIYLKDNIGCVDTLNVEIAQPDSIRIDELTLDSMFCAYPSVNELTNASGSGSIILELIGGTPSILGYQISIDQIDSLAYSYNNQFYNLTGGTYSFNVLDNLNCSFEFDVDLNGFTSSAYYEITPISCPGFDDGLIEIYNLNGNYVPWVEFDGQLMLDFSWNDISFGQHILSTHFQYPNNNSQICVNYDTLFFEHPDSILYDLESVSNNCYGDCEGSILIDNIVGGSSPYKTICINNSDTSLFVDQLCAGNYAIKVSDSLGCYNITQVSIIEPNSIYPLISQTNDFLEVLSPTLSNPTSGLPPYLYQWYDSDGILDGEVNETLQLTQEGRYYVVVEDSNDCQGVSSEFIVESVGFNQFLDFDISIFPNPVTEFLNVKTNSLKEFKWILSDSRGRYVKNGVLKQSMQISMNSLNKGVYFISLFDDQEEIIYKIIKY